MPTPKKGVDLIPPGRYEVVIERTRKVRNKPFKKVHMRIVGTDQTFTQIMRIDE